MDGREDKNRDGRLKVKMEMGDVNGDGGVGVGVGVGVGRETRIGYVCNAAVQTKGKPRLGVGGATPLNGAERPAEAGGGQAEARRRPGNGLRRQTTAKADAGAEARSRPRMCV